jgi:molecular chaperone DnaK
LGGGRARQGSPILGIDLGTTNSCVAVMDGGEVRVLANAEGSRTTPSVVAFVGDEVLVGQAAAPRRSRIPRPTIFAAKRLIGRKFADLADCAGSPVHDGRRRQRRRLDRGPRPTRRSPSQISAHVLAYLRDAAEDALGEPITRAIITVPAYFDDAQRQATRDAGPSPASASSGSSASRPPPPSPTACTTARTGAPKIVAVYDLGGGTFDVSILELRSGVFEVLATAGDSLLGGEDFDHAIVEQLADRLPAPARRRPPHRPDRPRPAARRGAEGQARAVVRAVDRAQPAVHRRRGRPAAAPRRHADPPRARAPHRR